jgi:hypothetical protein
VLNNAGGFNSYVAVQNASSDAADVRVTYFNAAGQQQGSPTTNQCSWQCVQGLLSG